MYTWQWGKKRVAKAYAALPGLTVNDLINLKEEKLIKIPAEPEKWLILTSVERFTSREKNLIRRLQLTIFAQFFNFQTSNQLLWLGRRPQSGD